MEMCVADHHFLQSDRKTITNMKQMNMTQTITITLILLRNLRNPIVVKDQDIGIQTMPCLYSQHYKQFLMSNIKLDSKVYYNHLFDADACQPPRVPVKALAMHFQMPLVNDKVGF